MVRSRNSMKLQPRSHMFVSQLVNALRSSRPSISILAGTLAAGIIERFSPSGLATAFLRAVPIVLVTMAGFVFNDIVDRRKDMLSGKNRPLAIGTLAARFALQYGLLLTVVAVSIEVIIGNASSILCLVLASAGVVAYSHFAKNFPLLKEFYTAALCCIPLYYATAIVGLIPHLDLVLPLFLFISGRELLLDLADLEGDLAYGIRTLPSYIGRAPSIWLGWSTMWVSAIYLAIRSQTTGTLVASILLLALLMSSNVLFRYRARTALGATRLAMAFGVITVVLSL